MATNLSTKQIKIAVDNFYGNNYTSRNFIFKIYLFIKKKLEIRFKNYSNYFLNFFKKKKLKKILSDKINLDYPKLNLLTLQESENFKKSYEKYGYFYLDKLFEEAFYKKLNNNWPDNSFFYQPDTPNKNYAFSFKYCSDVKLQKNYMNMKNGKVRNIEYFSYLESLYDFLINSSDMKNFIENFTGKKGFKLYSIAASIAFEKSFLTPHYDTVIYDNKTPVMLNIIYFVDGSDDPINSGGTGIYSDNNFENPLLIPKSLKNSAIIYNSKSSFFHGFNIMKKNNFRRAITFQFRLNL